MNTEIQNSTTRARLLELERRAADAARTVSNAAPVEKRREGMFVPFAAFASLAGLGGFSL